MEKYDISDNFRDRVHTVRVTFQYQEYKGHIAYEMGGNCRGLNILTTLDFYSMSSDEIDMLVENDCNFKLDCEYEVFQMILKDKEGNTCEFDDLSDTDIENYVVAIEIIDCKIDEDD